MQNIYQKYSKYCQFTEYGVKVTNTTAYCGVMLITAEYSENPCYDKHLCLSVSVILIHHSDSIFRTRMKMTGSDKHTNLLRYGFNYYHNQHKLLI
jgi:hypothetical protein